MVATRPVAGWCCTARQHAVLLSDAAAFCSLTLASSTNYHVCCTMLLASTAQPASFGNGRMYDSGKDLAHLALAAPAIGAGLSGHQAIKLKLLN